MPARWIKSNKDQKKKSGLITLESNLLRMMEQFPLFSHESKSSITSFQKRSQLSFSQSHLWWISQCRWFLIKSRLVAVSYRRYSSFLSHPGTTTSRSMTGIQSRPTCWGSTAATSLRRQSYHQGPRSTSSSCPTTPTRGRASRCATKSSKLVTGCCCFSFYYKDINWYLLFWWSSSNCVLMPEINP